MNLKRTIAYSHWCALNDCWLYDEQTCIAVKVVENSLHQAEELEATASLSIVPLRTTIHYQPPQTTLSYRIFEVQTLRDPGRFRWVDDPWIPKMRDAVILGNNDFKRELEDKLRATKSYLDSDPWSWLKIFLNLNPEQIKIILEDPFMYGCRPDKWILSALWLSTSAATLGSWLHLWYDDDIAISCPECGNRCLPYGGQSLLSIGHCDCWCRHCSKPVRIEGHVLGMNMRCIKYLEKWDQNPPVSFPYRLDGVAMRIQTIPSATHIVEER